MLRIPDRFWWAQRYGGLLFVAGCLTGAVFDAIQAYDTNSAISQFPAESETLRGLLGGMYLSCGVCVFCAAFAVVFFVWGSFHTRERFRRRLRAIEGDQEAMLHAKINVNAGRAPDLASGPLELLWRATSYRAWVMTTVYLLMIALCGALTVFQGYLVYVLTINAYVVWRTSPLLGIVDVAYIVGFAATLLAMIGLIRYLPWERGRPYGVTASSEGLWYYPKGRKRRFLRWEEACLLEVGIPLKDQGYLRGHLSVEYKLYGQRGWAEWVALPSSMWVSPGLTKQELEQRHQALLNLIVARTHLLPRTFNKRLAEASSV